MVLNGAATVTLCWRRKASHFWIMLLLVSRTADHGWALAPRSAIWPTIEGHRVQCPLFAVPAVCSSFANASLVHQLCIVPENLCDISNR
jgi:hypothetical protein